MIKIKSPIKKSKQANLSDWVIQNFPKGYEDMVYCEPYCGGAYVMLNKNISNEEVISDTDTGVISIFKALRDEPKEFIDKVKKIKYSEKSFNDALESCKDALEPCKDYIEEAINEYVLYHMSQGGDKQRFAKSSTTGNKMKAWDSMLEELPRIAERISKAIILSKNALNVVKAWQENNCLIYLDPPHLPSQEESDSGVLENLIQLFQTIKNSKSKIVLSSQYSSFYKNHLPGWKCTKRKTALKTECLWKNF